MPAMTLVPPLDARAPARLWALVPCAGAGLRAIGPGGDAALPKQYQRVAGRPLVLHTLAALAGVARLAGTLVAVAAGDDFLAAHAHPAWLCVPCGGPARADTVLGGIRALQERGARDGDWVLVHDAARCLVTSALIDALIDACLRDSVGGLLAHRLADTLKSAIDGPQGARAVATVERGDKWLAQTPQMFRIGALRAALERAGPGVTDEASAMEAVGLRPLLVPGGAQNFKVTYPEDFALAEAVLLQRQRNRET
jgi:2-C-methyl-D-erythritol 4-phosphate cytidylyltransferase